MDVAAVLLALVTLAAGLAAGWALASRRAADAVAVARTSATEAAALAQATAAAASADRDAARAELAQVRKERDIAAAELRTAEARLAEAGTRLKSQDQVEEELKRTFAALSSDALRSNRQEFLALADDRFKLAGAPISESLQKVGQQLGEIERNRAVAQEALKQQIEFVRLTGEQLKHETASLVSALRKPQTRGQWGELQLRRCVEYAGMLDRCDFTEQATVSTPDGALRPDMVVNLVGGKTIVVDSKVTLVGYLDAHEADDEAQRAEHLARHARHLRQHVDALAAKSYWSQFAAAPEFVIMFVPGDGPLNAALEQEPTLLEYAMARRVQILGPMSLVPTLRAIAYAWQQQALADNAREVFDLGREMYKRLGVMGDHMDKLGRSLTGAVKAYNGTVGSLEKNVLVTARKLNALKVVDAQLDAPKPVEEPVRPLGAPELVASAEEARHVVVLSPADAPAPADLPGIGLDRDFDDYGIEPVRDSERDRRTGS
jgi:DNA recombination protein RmuC